MKLKIMFAGVVVVLLIAIVWLQMDARHARLAVEAERLQKQKVADQKAEVASLLYGLDEVEKTSSDLETALSMGRVQGEQYKEMRRKLDDAKSDLQNRLARFLNDTNSISLTNFAPRF